MAYKSKFRPSEVLRNGQWQPLEDLLANKITQNFPLQSAEA
jgi:arginyl-tRNA--protein-N-Asp/Glu arginylyltransferase